MRLPFRTAQYELGQPLASRLPLEVDAAVLAAVRGRAALRGKGKAPPGCEPGKKFTATGIVAERLSLDLDVASISLLLKRA